MKSPEELFPEATTWNIDKLISDINEIKKKLQQQN